MYFQMYLKIFQTCYNFQKALDLFDYNIRVFFSFYYLKIVYKIIIIIQKKAIATFFLFNENVKNTEFVEYYNGII